MSFDLRIHFVGLNLFVPEEPSRMHVLLPTSNGHKKHFARIIFDTAYLTAGNKELTRTYDHVDIEGRVVDLTGIPVAEPGIDTHLPEEIPSIEPFITALPRSLVTSPPDPNRVTARLSLGTGSLSFYNLGARFFLGDNEPRRYASRTEWTVRGITSMEAADDGARAVLPARDLPGVDGSMVQLPRLYPIGKTIHLLLFHAISEEFPPHGEDFNIQKPDKSEADHFQAYYSISGLTAIGKGPIPTTAEAEPVACEGAKVDKDGEETPGHTCLGAKARLESIAPMRAESASKTKARAEDRPRTGRIPIGHHVV